MNEAASALRTVPSKAAATPFVDAFWGAVAGGAGWICVQLGGAPIGLDDALAIKALLSIGAAVAFLVPVSADVQAAGYASLGAIFGVPPGLSLGVSLIRRARDAALGIPILAAWPFAARMQRNKPSALSSSGVQSRHPTIGTRGPTAGFVADVSASTAGRMAGQRSGSWHH